MHQSSKSDQKAGEEPEQEMSSFAVAHELKGPLRHIQAYTAMAADAAANGNIEEALALPERVRVRTAAMAGLVEDLVQFGRNDNDGNGQTESSEPVDISVIARDIVDDLRDGDPKRRFRFRCLGPLEVRADPSLIRVVLRNLLENAWKYSAECETTEIEVGCRRSTSTTEFFVRDDGVGFDSENAGSPFAPFVRMHGSHRFEGSGIGLATVAKIIHPLGGRVRCESRVDEGATFYFSIPNRDAGAVGTRKTVAA